MASPIDLLSVAQVEAQLNSANTSSYNTTFLNTLIPLAISAVSQDWLSFTGRRSLNRFIPCNDFFDGMGPDRQFLADFPAALVTALWINGTQIQPGGWNNNGTVIPGYVLDRKRESISLVGVNYNSWGMGSGSGSGGTYAATGGPLTRQGVGWNFGRNDASRQNVQIQYFAGGGIMFDETQQVPATPPYQITVSQSGTNNLFGQGPLFYMDLGVICSMPQNGQMITFSQVLTPIQAGQYSVDVNGVYTFSSVDAGRWLAITYGYNAPMLDIQQAALESVQLTLQRRLSAGLKSQSDQVAGTTSYVKAFRADSALPIMEKYRRAMVGV